MVDGLTTGTGVFFSVYSAVHDMKVTWNKFVGIIADGKLAVNCMVSEEAAKAVKLHCIKSLQVIYVKYFA